MKLCKRMTITGQRKCKKGLMIDNDSIMAENDDNWLQRRLAKGRWFSVFLTVFILKTHIQDIKIVNHCCSVTFAATSPPTLWSLMISFFLWTWVENLKRIPMNPDCEATSTITAGKSFCQRQSNIIFSHRWAPTILLCCRLSSLGSHISQELKTIFLQSSNHLEQPKKNIFLKSHTSLYWSSAVVLQYGI